MKKLLLSSYSGCPNQDQGGGNKVIYQLLAELDKNKFDIKYLSYNAEKNFSANNPDQTEEYLIRKIGKYLHKQSSIYRTLTSSSIYLRYYYKKRDKYFSNHLEGLKSFDIIHSHDSIVHFHYKDLIKPKKILTIHSKGSVVSEMRSHFQQKSFYQLFKKKFAERERIAFASSDIVVFPSKAAKDYFISDLELEDTDGKIIMIIHNGIDLESIKKISPLNIDEELKISTNQFTQIILNVAAHVPEKRMDVLIKSIYDLKYNYKQNPLLINIGHGYNTRKVSELIHQFGLTENVILIGKANNNFVIGLMKACKYFVITSEKVIFDLALLEALACGCCVIASNIGGNREVIKDNFNGYLLKDLQPEIISKQILESDPEKVRSNAITTASDFSIKRMINHYRELYDEL